MHSYIVGLVQYIEYLFLGRYSILSLLAADLFDSLSFRVITIRLLVLHFIQLHIYFMFAFFNISHCICSSHCTGYAVYSTCKSLR